MIKPEESGGGSNFHLSQSIPGIQAFVLFIYFSQFLHIFHETFKHWRKRLCVSA